MCVWRCPELQLPECRFPLKRDWQAHSLTPLADHARLPLEAVTSWRACAHPARLPHPCTLIPSLSVTLISQAGAPPDARDLNKWAALHHAAWRGQCAAARALLAAGANPNLKDRWARTPLGWAAYGNHAEVCEALLAADAEAQASFERGRSMPQVRARVGSSLPII